MVFDVGGGSKPVKDRVASWNVGKYLILDNNLEEPIPDTLTIDCDLNYGITNELAGEMVKADVIFCLEVFEYVWNPLLALKTLNQMLRKGGKLIITFPFVYPTHQPVVHDCLRYTKYGAYKLLEEAGFDMDSIIVKSRDDKSGLLESFYKADGMHPAKGEDHSECGYIVEIRK